MEPTQKRQRLVKEGEFLNGKLVKGKYITYYESGCRLEREGEFEDDDYNGYGKLYNYTSTFRKENVRVEDYQKVFNSKFKNATEEEYYLINHGMDILGSLRIKFVKKTEVNDILLYRDPTSEQTITDAIRASLAPGGSRKKKLSKRKKLSQRNRKP